MKPNGVTAFAVAHPFRWGVVSAVLLGLWDDLLFHDLRIVIPGSIGIGALTVVLWRPGGRGARWAERQPHR
jgi:hypothetical protein